jgi:hypothetical protein
MSRSDVIREWRARAGVVAYDGMQPATKGGPPTGPSTSTSKPSRGENR